MSVQTAVLQQSSRLRVGFALLVSFVLLALPAGVWPRWGQDEGTYTSQADAVLHGTLSWSTYWYDHPPLAWMLLSVPMRLIAVVTGDKVTAARVVSALAVTASLFLVYGIARRLSERKWLSLAAPAFMLSSYLTWDVFRMVFLDTYAVPFILLGIYLVLDPKRRLWAFIVAAVVLALGVLSKETFLLMIPGIAYLAWQRLSDGDKEVRRILRPFAATGFACMGLSVIALYPIMALMKGELFPSEGKVSLWNSVVFQLGSRGGSGSIFEADSERQNLWLVWLSADRALIVLLIAAAFLVLVRRWRWLTVTTVLFVLPAVAGSGYLPVMHIIGIIPLVALVVVAVLDTVARLLPKQAQPYYAALAGVVVVAGFGLRSYDVVGQYQGDENALNRQALAWLDENGDRSKSVMVGGSLLVQVSQLGWTLEEDPDQGMALPHEKLDLDPIAAARMKPCSVGYVVVTEQVQIDIQGLGLPKLQAAIDSSTSGWSRGGIDIREVHQECR